MFIETDNDGLKGFALNGIPAGSNEILVFGAEWLNIIGIGTSTSNTNKDKLVNCYTRGKFYGPNQDKVIVQWRYVTDQTWRTFLGRKLK